MVCTFLPILCLPDAGSCRLQGEVGTRNHFHICIPPSHLSLIHVWVSWPPIRTTILWCMTSASSTVVHHAFCQPTDTKAATIELTILTWTPSCSSEQQISSSRSTRLRWHWITQVNRIDQYRQAESSRCQDKGQERRVQPHDNAGKGAQGQ